MKPTAESLQKMCADPDCIKVVNALFEAIAYEQTVSEMIKPKQQEVIDFFKFPVKAELIKEFTEINRLNEIQNPITDPELIYYASDEDCELYYKEMHRIHLELGFKVKLHYCPILMAQSKVRDVKVEVANFLEPYMGLNYDQISYSLDGYKKYYDLVMKAFAPAVKEYQKTNAIKPKK